MCSLRVVLKLRLIIQIYVIDVWRIEPTIRNTHEHLSIEIIFNNLIGIELIAIIL